MEHKPFLSSQPAPTTSKAFDLRPSFSKLKKSINILPKERLNVILSKEAFYYEDYRRHFHENVKLIICIRSNDYDEKT